MSTYWIIGILLTVALLIAVIVGYWLAHRIQISKKLPASHNVVLDKNTGAAAPHPLPKSDDLYSGHNLAAFDHHGNALIRAFEIESIPTSSTSLADKQGVVMERIKFLTGQIFKDVSTLPSKTVELVFDPHIQQGLLDGTLEIMPAIGGGSRLMARDVGTKSIAGHGRVLDGGRVRQIATGAFHVVSIAVAQSHLDDINRSLSEIKSSVEDVKKYLENKDIARLRGTIAYLEYLVSFMNNLTSPERVPSEKRNQLEAIRRESMEWSEQLRVELSDLKSKIKSQQDVDLSGTEHTFNAMKTHANSMERLIEKRNFLLRIMILLDVGTAYLDPLTVDDVSKNFMVDGWEDMKAIESVLSIFRDQSNLLLSKSFFNKNVTLDKRRDELILQQEKLAICSDQNFQNYVQTTNALDQHFQRMRKNNQEIRMALSYDQNGDVKQVALL